MLLSILLFTIPQGFETTLRYLWGNPDRNGSSTLFIGQGYYEQYVDTNDAPWTNGNATSNRESITAEVRGDWRFGYYDKATLDALTEAMYQTLKLFPNLKLIYHMDVSRTGTLCPADLKHKGYALACWNKAKNRIKVEKEAEKSPANLRIDIPDKKVILTKRTNLWDMNFTKWSNARAIKSLPAGTVIDVAGKYDHPLSSTDYYLSNYSWNAGKNWGINIADTKDYVPPKPKPEPTPEPTPEPEPEPTPVPEIIPVPEEEDKEGPGTLPPVDENGEDIAKILQIVQWIKSLLIKIFNV